MFYDSGQIWARMRARLQAFALAGIAAVLLTPNLHAVVVRGDVRDPLGRPIGSARVQLLQGHLVIASGMSNEDGSYEIRSAASGRFVLLTGAAGYAANVSQPFYGGDLDVVTNHLTLGFRAVDEQVTVTATGLPTPMEQSSASVNLISPSDLATREGVGKELRLQPGVSVVQTGQNGGQTSLFVRGGTSDGNKVMVDGIPADDVGGRFDFGILSSTAVDGLEIHRGPDSVLYGSDAISSVVSFNTPHGVTPAPVLNYTGDAGNFHTYRNEGELSGAYRKIDYYTAFSRFDSSNALPMDRFHVTTAAANLGYSLSGSTHLRGTVRRGVSATGLPGAFDFAGIAAAGKQGDQQTFFGGTIDNIYRGNWHNLLRYFGSRKYEQATNFYPVGEAVNGLFGVTYYGNTVTIRGANGTSGTGRAAIAYGGTYPQPTDSANNRDGMQYQTDYRFTRHLSGYGSFRYEDERGAYHNPGFFLVQNARRRNYDYNVQLQGDVLNRVFFTLGGAIQKNYLYGTEATPRFGLAGYPVRPGSGWFHGTKLRFNFSKGVQEPNLTTQLTSLYVLLQQAGVTAAEVSPIGAQRLRTYEGGIDQSIYGSKLMLKFNYFHNEFGRQIEFVGATDITKYFGIPVPSSIANNYGGAYLNSLDFSAQGIETELEWRAGRHFFARGGYTYLDSNVQKSFSSDVTAQLPGGFPAINPNYPGIAIGSSSPLVGQRPFRRAPQTGYFVVQYTATRFTAAVKSAFSSRSDDSTFLSYSDFNGDNTLLLPNRNLDFGYQNVDANLTYQITSKFSVFTQMNNLLGQQHMGPIGYPSLPFNFRTGLKVRLGGG